MYKISGTDFTEESEHTHPLHFILELIHLLCISFLELFLSFFELFLAFAVVHPMAEQSYRVRPALPLRVF
jgi:hypothetical protein